MQRRVSKPAKAGKRKVVAKPAVSRRAEPASRGLLFGLAWLQFRTLRG